MIRQLLRTRVPSSSLSQNVRHSASLLQSLSIFFHVTQRWIDRPSQSCIYIQNFSGWISGVTRIPKPYSPNTCSLFSNVKCYSLSINNTCKRWSQISSHSQSIDFHTLTDWTQRLISRLEEYSNHQPSKQEGLERNLLIRNMEQVLFHWATLSQNSMPANENKCDAIQQIIQAYSLARNADRLLKPTVTSVRYIIEIHLDSYDQSQKRNDLDQAEKFYYTILDESKQKDTQIILETCFARIIHALCKSYKHWIKVETRMASQYLDRAWTLIHRTQSWQSKTMEGSKSTFWIPLTVEQDVDGMKRIYSIEVINAMLHLFSSMGDEYSLHRAKQILDDGEMKYPLVTLSYNLVLQGYCQVGRLEDAQKILVLWIDRYQNNSKSSNMPSPDVTSWNILLNAYADVGDSTKIENLLRIMENLRKDMRLQPDRVSYTALIRAYAMKGDAVKAEAILEKMIQVSLDFEEALPDHITYSSVIDSWGKYLSQKQKNHAHVSPLDWEHAIDRCWRIIQRMESKATGMNIKNHHSQLMPTTATFNSLLHLVNQCPIGNKASNEALRVFNYMNRRESTRASMVTFSILFPILGRGMMHSQAQNLFQQLIDGSWGEMNIVTVNAFLTTLVGQKSQSTIDYALGLLNKMKKWGNEKPALFPTTRTYNIILNILAKSGKKPDLAEQVLTEMENLYRYKTSTVIPNTISYTSCINAIARSDATDKIQRTRRILQRIQQSYHEGNMDAHINTILLNSVLNSCCFVISKTEFKDALTLAQELMQWTYESHAQGGLMNVPYRVKLDSISYATAIKILKRTIPDVNECEAAVANMFRKCIEEDLINSSVLQALRNCTTPTLYQSLIEEYNTSSVTKSKINVI